MANSEQILHEISYTLAGIRINSNLEIEITSHSEYTDGEVNILFQKEGISTASLFESWLVSIQPNGLPTYISQNGINITVIEHKDEICDRALEVRRVLPYASFLQRKPILHASSV